MVGRLVRRPRRDGALSAVSTGTTFGVVAMALAALAVTATGLGWRGAWAGFAVAGAAAGIAAHALLPPSRRLRPRALEAGPAPRALLGELARRAAWPLHGGAFVFGAASAVFATFAVEHATAGGGPAADPARMGGAIYLVYGTLGAAGLLTARIERAIGLRALVAGCFVLAAGAALAMGLWSGPGPGASVPALPLIGAGGFGVVVMVFSVVMAIWSLRVFPRLPVIGFTAAIVASSVGSVVAPPAAGLLAQAQGTGTAGLTNDALSREMYLDVMSG